MKDKANNNAEKDAFFEGILEGEGDDEEYPLFVEMMHFNSLGREEWREASRWVKYEENVEQGGKRWSKPFVPTVKAQAIHDLRKGFDSGAIIVDLDFDTGDGEGKTFRQLVERWAAQGSIEEMHRAKILQTLLRPKVHHYEESGLFQKRKKQEVHKPKLEPHMLQHRRTSLSSVVYHHHLPKKDDEEKNLQFMRKIASNAECVNVMVGQLYFLQVPIAAFLRLGEAVVLGNLTEVPLPTRFLFVLLAPVEMDFYEIGRAVGTMFTDPRFRSAAYKADKPGQILQALEAFQKSTSLLPPASWDASIRLEPQAKDGSGDEDSDEEDNPEDTGLVRSGKLFGGLYNDVKRKLPWYKSDITDALSLQCLATWLFLYFACLTPIITFGGLMGLATHNYMGTIETMMAGALCGVGFALFSGQPLLILGSTGPVLVFETILVHFSESNGLDYLEFRLWVGVWIAAILVVLVALDASSLVSYITRFTEDDFATLIAVIFMVEAVKNVMLIRNIDHDIGSFGNYTDSNGEDLDNNITEGAVPWNWEFAVDNDYANSTTEPHPLITSLQAQTNQTVFLMSLLLFFGTFFVSFMLKEFRVSPFFPTAFRYIVSDFSVVLAIGACTLVDFLVGIQTPKLVVPDKFAPTSDERGWVISPFGKNPFWSIFAAILPALLATILIFMDQQITAVIVNRKDHKLRKGCGYHLDLFLLAGLICINSFLGLPWFCAATVESLTNVNSLKMESESAAPGEKPRFLGVREQRVSNVLVFLSVGLSVLLTPILKFVPMPVLYGVFLYMGFSALMRMELFERILLFAMPLKYQPDHGYLRNVPLARVHLFTLIQLLCLILLWVIKSMKATAILFPLMLVVMMVVRKLLDYIFTQKELQALDDLLPDSKRKKTKKTVPPPKKLASTAPPRSPAVTKMENEKEPEEKIRTYSFDTPVEEEEEDAVPVGTTDRDLDIIEESE